MQDRMTGCYQNYIIRTVLLSAYFRNAQFTNINVNGTFVYLSYRVLMFMFEVANDILLQSLSKVQAVGSATLVFSCFYRLTLFEQLQRSYFLWGTVMSNNRAYQTVGTVPPSITYSLPLIDNALSETRNAISSATSSGRPGRPIGMPPRDFINS